MVSFSCENCGDVLTKKKLDPHRSRCRGATFTCIDCMVHFPGTDYRTHTSCMTEDQKYQGALYKGKKQKPQALVAEVVEAPEPATDSANMAHNAYVEDCNEVYESYQDYQVQDDFEGGFPPEAPTPPSALPHDDQVNVFDFMQQPTPNASNFDLPAPGVFPTTGGRQLVRFNDETDNDVDPEGYMVDTEDNERYGREQARAYETPMPKAARRKTKDGEVKKDKKRKRLHIDTSPPPATAADEVMTDAPPVLHSGLTGGLNRMMRPSQFPPSPDYSGADGDAHSPGPANPLKKSKEAKPPKATRTESFGSGLKALISGTSKPKATKKRKTKHIGDKKERKERKERKDKKERKEHRDHKEPRKHHHHHHSGAEDDKKPKLIEYRPQSRDESKEGETGTMVLYKPRSDLFLSLCTKGPDSERGCSVNKALKRFHRERDSSTDSLGKFVEEKELWRSLRMRKNDRGEIVLFSIAEPEE